MSIKKRLEYEDIVSDILDNAEFKKLHLEPHHGISRYDHVLRVSKVSYFLAKNLKLGHLEEITRAALLHDFYFDKDLVEYDAYEKLSIHPKAALKEASKYYDLTDLEKDVIVKHMYPHTKSKPKYVGSYLVSVSDKLVATYEMVRFKVSLRFGIYLLFIYNVVSIRIQQ